MKCQLDVNYDLLMFWFTYKFNIRGLIFSMGGNYFLKYWEYEENINCGGNSIITFGIMTSQS